jgi:hypothetical protein
MRKLRDRRGRRTTAEDAGVGNTARIQNIVYQAAYGRMFRSDTGVKTEVRMCFDIRREQSYRTAKLVSPRVSYTEHRWNK